MFAKANASEAFSTRVIGASLKRFKVTARHPPEHPSVTRNSHELHSGYTPATRKTDRSELYLLCNSSRLYPNPSEICKRLASAKHGNATAFGVRSQTGPQCHAIATPFPLSIEISSFENIQRTKPQSNSTRTLRLPASAAKGRICCAI